MADAAGPPGEHLSWVEALAREPGAFDFHVALRRIDAASPSAPRLGEALRPVEEPVRIGQTPSLSFEPTPVNGYVPPRDGSPARLLVSFFGMWGPNGPLPLHLTEYARDRTRQAGDRTLTAFMDLFHHRMLLLFHRAWAQAHPITGLDRSGADAFAAHVGSLLGAGFAATRGRDAFPDRAKLYYAGRLASPSRNAEGLRDILADHFGVPARVEEFVGDWLPLAQDSRWRLGAGDSSQVGRTAVLGARVWSRCDRFRIVLGPLSRPDFTRFLPGSDAVAELAALVRLYTNDEWGWDVQLTLDDAESETMCLARGTRLGWTSRLGRGAREDLVFDPVSRRTLRVRPRHQTT